MEQQPETNIEKIPEGRSNLEICPNCLEPNPDDLAVCSYCGRPLHPGDEEASSVMTEDEATLAAARAEAVSAEKKPEKKRPKSGFRTIMPWLGLYLIYNAVISCIEIGQQRKLPAEEQPNYGLAYLSAAIWFAAGLLMAWPLVKKGWRKLRHLPDEEEEKAEEQQPENGSAEETSETQTAETEEDGSFEDETAAENTEEAPGDPDDSFQDPGVKDTEAAEKSDEGSEE